MQEKRFTISGPVHVLGRKASVKIDGALAFSGAIPPGVLNDTHWLRYEGCTRRRFEMSSGKLKLILGRNPPLPRTVLVSSLITRMYMRPLCGKASLTYTVTRDR